VFGNRHFALWFDGETGEEHPLMLACLGRLVTLAGILVVRDPSFGALVEVRPTAVTVLYGRIVSGDATSLAVEDGSALRVSRFTVPNSLIHPVMFRLEGNLPSSTTSLSFSILGRKVTNGVYSQSLNFYNWTTNLYDPYTNVTGLLQGTYTSMTCTAPGDVSRYVRNSDRKVMALVRVRPVGPTPILQWETEYDRAYFVADSGP